MFQPLVFLWCIIYAQAACSICVGNSSESIADCQHSNITNWFSDVTAYQTSCRALHVYLTSGTHILKQNIAFTDSVEEIAIIGARQPSIIECWNETGIRFSSNGTLNNVSFTNIVLSHCNSKIVISGKKEILAALYFRNVPLVTLHSVLIQNTEGYGLYIHESSTRVDIFNCAFYNTHGHIQVIFYGRNLQTSVSVHNTKFLNSDNDAVYLNMSKEVNCNFSMVGCEFRRNRGSHLQIHNGATINIHNCSFIASNNKDTGIIIYSRSTSRSMIVVVQGSNFINHNKGVLRIMNAYSSEIRDCSFIANNKIGILIYTSQSQSHESSFLITNCIFQRNRGMCVVSSGGFNSTIQNCTFNSNERGALHIRNVNHSAITESSFNSNSLVGISIQTSTLNTAKTVIRNCLIDNTTGTGIAIEGNGNKGVEVTLDQSTLQRTHGNDGDCSALHVSHTKGFMLKNTKIKDNYCTGVKLSASWVEFEGFITLVRNFGFQGGALSLKSATIYLVKMSSKLIFTKSSQISIINNTANTYGGGIYSDEICTNDQRECFFEVRNYLPEEAIITFSGNSAKLGGDIVFGGCLSNCLISINETMVTINKQDTRNFLWDLLVLENTLSPSTLAEYPKRVSFCTNISGGSRVTCNNSYTAVNAYWGETFSIPLMAVDDLCYPSVKIMEASVEDKSISLQRGSLQQSQKYCHDFHYVVVGGLEPRTTAIKVNIQGQLSSDTSTALLTVHLESCPIGFEISDEEKCDCMKKLITYKIGCHFKNYSLEIPGRTWVGVVGQSLAVQIDCHFCQTGKLMVSRFAKQDSNLLCIANRQGVMCGACMNRHSLLLGSYECADCSNSAYKGVLLLIAFTAVGMVLVLLLLCLNLTVSTGMINGLIFYSNIVYLNSDILLPITSEGTHLQNIVKLLSTFQAWINLDFGIVTCFFDGYDIYTGAWMQFIFPVYIWLLIVIIVLASRCSTRVSRITKSNTVSVLATLLLLAYAKLLKTVIEGIAFAEAEFLNDSSTNYRSWILDGNTPHLSGKHIPLFLMSMLTVVAYLLPFTLLVFLGPSLQARSHYRLLNWVCRLKPFLDAFYGPYTIKYRYWPGILLLARLAIYTAFMIYTPNERLFKIVSIVVMMAVLFVIWMVIGKTHTLSIYQKRNLNYLELFFLVNLGIFAVASIYTTQFIEDRISSQHALAVVMVGSVLALVCVILAYQILSALKAKFNIQLGRAISSKDDATMTVEDTSMKVTQSSVEMTACTAPSDELREPLLDIQ